MKTFRKHFIYWILPVIVLIPCILIFFYNPGGLSKFIAPEFNREFGILENLQLVLLTGAFIVALRGIRVKRQKAEKLACKLLAIGAVFLFLEEIDYGLHYYEYIIGKTKAEVDYQIAVQHQVRNIHNIGKMNSIIKFLVYLCIAVLFVVMPLLPKKFLHKHRWIEYFSPSRYFIGTAMAMLILNQVVQYLNTIFYDQNIALAGNASEFEEVMIYYICLLYLWEMISKPLPKAVQKSKFAYFCGLRTKWEDQHT